MDFKDLNLRLMHIEKLLLSNKSVLTLNEAAEYSGLSKSYLYKLTSTGMIPHSKPNGKQCYFSKEELDSWLLRNSVKTKEALESAASTYLLNNKKPKY